LSGKPSRKIAFAATRRVGNSPERHRHVRKLREFYRLNKELFAENGHYFLLVRAPVKDWTQLELKLKGILNKLTC